MDIPKSEQARITQRLQVATVLTLERIPADIRAVGGVSQMEVSQMIKEIQKRSAFS